ncbi:exopolysaccharide biosynthesis protein [Jannaschia formosa]|uniref:exopolysaccharide biosynthesis protein n=1 Tax=Jannaschia formosa TaxID=2259592 RepID=UPI001430B181|nr:exopolysaccharide biosynthesis protein [Jannaschia formosa]
MRASAPPVAPVAPPERPFSELLETLGDLGGSGRAVALGDVLAMAGTRAHGAGILLLALPDAIPAPVPSLAAVLGIPLVLISAHLAANGERAALPARMLRWPVPGRVLAAMARTLVRPLAWAERWTRPRLPRLARRERLAGVVCLALSVLLLLPVPLMNVPPAAALVLIAWGLVQRDGAFVAAGFVASAGIAAALAFAFRALVGLLS